MSVRKSVLLVSLLWGLVIVTSLSWNIYASLKWQEQLAFSTAKSFFQQIVITRQWNAKHGGVYAPVTETTIPNPHLQVPDRDITVDNRLLLTKINPAYMTRQISELAKNSKGIQFHITSLNPIRPKNAATKLESAYLKKFENGLAEGGEFLKNDEGKTYFYMAPLITKKSCLNCHAQQGYKEGDIRGGISVQLPFNHQVPIINIILSHIGIGLLGLVGLGLVEKKLSASYRKVREQAVMDALTGIPNRRSFTESILQAFLRSQKEKEPLSIIMCDIDNFKKYNDTYGHAAGDECLIKVAQGLKASLKRPTDFCARYGGEEFTVILVDTNSDGAKEVAERIRVTIEEMKIEHMPPPSDMVTVSLGVATLDNGALDSYEDLIKQADDALYKAKDSGRNQVQVFNG